MSPAAYMGPISNGFQGQALVDDLAHIYLQCGDMVLRVGIHRNWKDDLLHCACGLKFPTVEQAQIHGRGNRDPKHSTDFLSLFLGDE